MTDFIVFPGVTGENVFAPEIRQAIADAPELKEAFAPKTGSDAYAALTDVTALIGSKMNASEKGQASGVAALDADSKLSEANIPVRLTPEVQNATYLPQWKPNTFYPIGSPVVNSYGEVVTAKAAFTSTASYDPSNWKLPTIDGGTP